MSPSLIHIEGQGLCILPIAVGSQMYRIIVTKKTSFYAYYIILKPFKDYAWFLYQSLSVTVYESNEKEKTPASSFAFIVLNTDSINMAYNRPSNIQEFSNFFIEKMNSKAFAPGNTEYNAYWGNRNSYLVPYIPYISNCEGLSYFHLPTGFQNSSDCELINPSKTEPINEFRFGSSAVADSCIIKRSCVYDQSPSEKVEFPIWQSLPALSVVFSMTSSEVQGQGYDITSDVSPSSLIPCKLMSSQGNNGSESYPLKVNMQMSYYQISETKKIMINCEISYSLYVASYDNFSYQLQILLKPMNHTEILLAFGFDWYIYMIVFALIGVISNVENLILWAYHYFFSEREHKTFKVKIYLRAFKQIFIGTLLGCTIILILAFLVVILMNGRVFGYLVGPDNGPRVIWDYIQRAYIKDYTSTSVSSLRAGRMGWAFIVIGLYITHLTSQFFVGRDQPREQYQDFEIVGRKIRPKEWTRGRFLWAAYFYILLSLILIYFAYSSLYSENIWLFIVLTKILQIILEEISESFFSDALPAIPFKILMDIIAYLNTLSANDFYDFLFSFLVDVAMTMLQKAYLAEIQPLVIDQIELKTEQINKVIVNIINDTEEEVQKSQQRRQEAYEDGEDQIKQILIRRQGDLIEFLPSLETQSYLQFEEEQEEKFLRKCMPDEYQLKLKTGLMESMRMEFRALHAQQDKQSQVESRGEEDTASLIFDIVSDNVLMMFTFLLQPFILLLLWLTFEESNILSSYGISPQTVILYLLSAIVICLFSGFNIVLIYNLLESYLDFSFEELIQRALERFQKRKTFWKADDDDLDETIETTLRGTDHYCLSSQFYFILTVSVMAMICIVIGIAIFMQSNYNVFSDPASVPIAIFWTLFMVCGKKLCEKIAKILNIWDYKRLCKTKEDTSSRTSKESQSISQRQIITNESFDSDWHSSTSIHTLRLIRPDLKLQNFQVNEEVKIIETKLATICKKLEPQFRKNEFKLQYSRKNKEFIKANIQKILSSVQTLPELKICTASAQSSLKQEEKTKKQTKSMDPFLNELLCTWLKAVDASKALRKNNGLQYQKKLKRCRFCYQTWAIYFGHDGMCLTCSKKMIERQD